MNTLSANFAHSSRDNEINYFIEILLTFVNFSQFNKSNHRQELLMGTSDENEIKMKKMVYKNQWHCFFVWPEVKLLDVSLC